MKKKKNMENQGLDLFGLELEQQVQISNAENGGSDVSLACEAIQIVRIVKTTMGKRRDILDTIKIDGARMTYERALKVAKMKASTLGNCMVVEKLERIVKVF